MNRHHGYTLRGWVPVRSCGSYVAKDWTGGIVVAPANADGSRSIRQEEWYEVAPSSPHYVEFAEALSAVSSKLPTVQTIVMRTFIRSWRTRYMLKKSELRIATRRTVTTISLFDLCARGLLVFEPLAGAFRLVLWNGRPIVRVARDGTVTPIKKQWAAWAAEQDRRAAA